MVTMSHARAAAAPPLRLAVHHEVAETASMLFLTNQLHRAVYARLVHSPQQVRDTDDLVVVPEPADTFLRGLAEAWGAAAPPVLIVKRDVPVREPEPAPTGQLAVHSGDTIVAPRLASTVTEPLTARERDIMKLLVGGFNIAEIAADLFLSIKTVRNNLTNVYRKLGVRGQAEAVLRWLTIRDAAPPRRFTRYATGRG